MQGITQLNQSRDDAGLEEYDLKSRLAEATSEVELVKRQMEKQAKESLNLKRRRIALASMGLQLEYQQNRAQKSQNTKEFARLVWKLFRLFVRIRLRTINKTQLKADFSNLDDESFELQMESYLTDCRLLEMNAYRRGLAIDPSWFNEDAQCLTPHGKASLERAIRLDRRNNIEWWMKLVIPLLAATTGLMGVLIGLVTVFRNPSP